MALIQCAKAMGIQKYVFYSIHNCDKHPEVPLMEIKYCTEKFLRDSGLNHIVIRLCGFMQVAFYIDSSSHSFILLDTLPSTHLFYLFVLRDLLASMLFLSWKRNLFGELMPQPELLTWIHRFFPLLFITLTMFLSCGDLSLTIVHSLCIYV